MKKPFLVALGLALVTFAAQAADKGDNANSASETRMTSEPMTSENVKPNNTEVNKRDRDGQTLTPMDQSNSKADINITQAIRKAIMKQKLSTNAKNIKVITQDGEVTLRGPVNSKTEVDKIVTLAKAVPGIKTLNNQLEVK